LLNVNYIANANSGNLESYNLTISRKDLGYYLMLVQSLNLSFYLSSTLLINLHFHQPFQNLYKQNIEVELDFSM
jgi:hypothetical protein